MKLMILTTETLHHTFFVKEIAKNYDDVMVLCETQNNHRVLYNTSHEFENMRNDFEKNLWFNEKESFLKNFMEVKNVLSINSKVAISYLKKINPDLIIVFGTGLIKNEILSLFENKIYNLHGGNPEEYRGLDSHLWSIFHRDYKSLITVIHKVTNRLDTGDIVLKGNISLHSGMKIYELQSSNTNLCLRLSNQLIEMSLNRNIVSQKQSKVGRYYHAMPSDLKSLVKIRFENYINENYYQ